MSNTNFTMSYASTSMSFLSSDMYMCLSTNDVGEWGDSDPAPYVSIPAPEEDFEFCNWCNAEWFPSEFYPGNCVSCGGPRKFTYSRRTIE